MTPYYRESALRHANLGVQNLGPARCAAGCGKGGSSPSRISAVAVPRYGTAVFQ